MLVALVVGLCGCAWKAYNPLDPAAYWEYWSKEGNKRQSLLYYWTEEARAGRCLEHGWHCPGQKDYKRLP
jgi:hypothetical protein